jgi:hypothetical protein
MLDLNRDLNHRKPDVNDIYKKGGYHMSNKFEKDSLKQINQLNEGLFTSLLRSLFFSSSAKKSLKKAKKIAKADPELQAALTDMEYNQKKIRDMLKTLCKRHPDHPTCQ